MAAMQMNDTEEIQARFASIMQGINLPEGAHPDDAPRGGSAAPTGQPVMGSWNRGRALSGGRNEEGMEVTFGQQQQQQQQQQPRNQLFTPAPAPATQVPLSQDRMFAAPTYSTPYVERTPVQESPGLEYGALPGSAFPAKGSPLILKSRINIIEAFPQFFTIFLFGVFAMPLYLCYHIGTNESVQFWIGDYILWALLLPALYLFTHIVHMITGKPSKFLVLLSLVGSCVLILIMADMVLMAAYTKANQFVADDCDTFSGKRELQQSWDAARVFYANCAARRAEATGISFEESVMVYRIQDCPDYESELAQHPDWTYLRDLEVNDRCSGWCDRGQELWSHSVTKDSCSMVVANVMINEVQYCALQVVIYVLTVVVFSAVMLVALGPRLRKMGVAW